MYPSGTHRDYHFENTYEKLEAKLNGRDRAKLEYATYAVRLDADTIAVQFHATNIVTHRRDGRITLDVQGWFSVNSRRRLNSYTPDEINVMQTTVPKGETVPENVTTLDNSAYEDHYRTNAYEWGTQGAFEQYRKMSERLSRQYWSVKTGDDFYPYFDGTTIRTRASINAEKLLA